MLRLNVEKLKQQVTRSSAFRTAGKLRSAQGVIRAALSATVGELCHIELSHKQRMLSEVIGFSETDALLLPYGRADGLRPGLDVIGLGRSIRVPVGQEVIGRVLNALGQPIDGLGRLSSVRFRPLVTESPLPLERSHITEAFETGQRAIDGLLTMGRGQRVGLFAGSGVGKSTLLGEIAKHAASEVNVVALVGERGREVRPFLDECLGPAGLRRSVVIVATSDEPPLMRLRAAQTAVTIADDFRTQGCNVMLMLDSITRLAHAQREVGLMLGEPPTARGYTPSVFQSMANLLEQLGQNQFGSITALVTVLVDGDDTEEPVSDTARSILDGHIVLDRRLAQAGHYPAIDISQSVSRLFTSVNDKQHVDAALKLRAVMQMLSEAEDLVRLGLYVPNSSQELDAALRLQKPINTLLRQSPNEVTPLPATRQAVQRIAQEWQW